MHPELQVSIDRLGNRYVAVTQGPNGREILRNEFQHETMHLTYLGPLWLIDQQSLVQEEKRRLASILKGQASLTQVAWHGQRLYRYLFGDGAGLQAYLSERANRTSYQLTLLFSPEASHLARQSWEYLFDGQRFPCLAGDFLISRRPAQVHPMEQEASTTAPLRILVVVAAPTDQVAIDPAEELGILHTALGDWLTRGAIELSVLPEPTSRSLLEISGDQHVHVVHFIGHAVYHLPQHRGFLCFEDELGLTELVSGTQLPRFIRGRSPALLTLSACRRSQVGIFDAFQNVATDLMDYEIPGVLSVPVSLPASTAMVLHRTLYGNLAQGLSVQESLSKARAAIRDADRANNGGKERYEWGVPALYQRAPEITPIAAAEEPVVPAKVADQQPVTVSPEAPFVGRARELQAVRKALGQGASIFYVLGGQGIGKHTFTAYAAQHLDQSPWPTLAIRCRDQLSALTALAKIAGFWGTSLPDADPQAAELLLDANKDPFDRAQRAQALLARKRFILVFEDLDAWFHIDGANRDQLRNETLQRILLGLLSKPGKAVFFFTATRRWRTLETVAPERRREITLPLLPLHYAIHVINHLPALRVAAASMEDRQAVYATVGGHPQALRVLDQWVASGNDLTALEGRQPAVPRSPEAWVDTFIADILSQRDPGELNALRALAVLTLPFNGETIANLTQVTAQHASPLIDAWLQIGLIQTAIAETGRSGYRFEEPARRAILASLTSAELATLHHQAATHYAAPYYDAARRQILARNITTWAVDRIGWLARDASGILGMALRQERTAEGRARLLASAYAWQHHLREAGNSAAAAQIIRTIAPVLNQLGQRDLSRQLLHDALDADDGAPHRDIEDLASLQLEEGPLTAALDVYEDVYESLDPDKAAVQRARVLLRAGSVKLRLGNAKAATSDFISALRIARRESDQESEAECLYLLATAYREVGQLQRALVCSQAAKEHYESLNYPNNLAIIEREQGLILEQMDRPESALQRLAASLRLCRELGDRRCAADNLRDIGRIFEKLGRTETAIRVIEEAVQYYEDLRDPEHGEVLALLEALYAHKKRLDNAVRRLRDSRRNA